MVALSWLKVGVYMGASTVRLLRIEISQANSIHMASSSTTSPPASKLCFCLLESWRSRSPTTLAFSSVCCCT